MKAPNTSRMEFLLEAPIGSMLFKLAAPNVAATLMTTATIFADVWFVGHLGTDALASLALVFPFLMLMNMMAGGAIGGGVTSALSRALGRNDELAARALAWHGLLIAGSMALIFTVVLGIFARPIYALMGGVGEALDGAVLYSAITFGGSIAVWLLWVLAAIIRGSGDMATPARVLLVSGLAQIGLSGMLTLGWGAVLSFGVAGTAIALVVCQGGAAVYLAVHLLKPNTAVSLYVQRVAWPPIKDIMRVGGLGLINSAGIALTVAVVTGYVGRYGTAALAGYGLGSRLELMLIPIAFGIGAALTLAVGTNFGAGNYARARKIAWTGAGVVFVFMTLAGLIFAIQPHLWLGLFTADPKAYDFGAQYLFIVAPFCGFFGGGQTLYFACQGTGFMTLPVLVGMIRLLVVSMIGAVAIYFTLDINTTFAGVAAGLVVIGTGLALCMKSAVWNPLQSTR